jgi:hypothetical protein
MNNCQTTIVNQKTKHHTYSMVRKVGNGNFGEAYLVESTLDSKLYIMKVSFWLFSALALKIEIPSSKSRSLNR